MIPDCSFSSIKVPHWINHPLEEAMYIKKNLASTKSSPRRSQIYSWLETSSGSTHCYVMQARRHIFIRIDFHGGYPSRTSTWPNNIIGLHKNRSRSMPFVWCLIYQFDCVNHCDQELQLQQSQEMVRIESNHSRYRIILYKVEWSSKNDI